MKDDVARWTLGQTVDLSPVTGSLGLTPRSSTKRCSNCGRDLSWANFDKNAGVKNGHASQCRECTKIGKQHNRREKKYALVQAMGGQCTRCGYNKSLSALQFHHPNQNKEYGVPDLLRVKFERALVEAKKCELLCGNCHAEIHEKTLDSSYKCKRLPQMLSKSLNL